MDRMLPIQTRRRPAGSGTDGGEYLPALPISSPVLSDRLQKLLRKNGKKKQPPVILCIGTDRIIGDSLGPVVGSALEKDGTLPYVYGTLTAPVHALNLPETIKEIESAHPYSAVIAVDASLGARPHIGSVAIHDGGLRPGAGVQKELQTVGDISITGVTNLEDSYPWLALQTARLSTVVAMADCITACICDAYRRLY